jgi:excisionase family DNA binding protein
MMSSSGAKLPKFFTVKQVAECLDVSTKTVQRWIKSGALPIHRFERTVRISPVDFAAFLATRRDG